MERQILHVDMNAFFASVEQRANPDLAGKPVAVVGSSHRTVITTCSYEARAFGVKTGMAIWEGKRACPGLLVVVGDNRKYTDTSRRIIAMMREYTPLVEVFSIDEAFMDVTGSTRLFGSPRTIAYQLKARIKHQLGLTCSIGIAPNKLLAKLASDMQKPDGLTEIPAGEVSRILEEVPVSDLCGIGRTLTRQLQLLGIETCGQLGRFPRELLVRQFGLVGHSLWLMGQGSDDRPVKGGNQEDPVKSVGHSMTLASDVTERSDIVRHLLQLSEMVGRRARRYGLAGRTVHLDVRFSDLRGTGIQQTMAEAVNRSDEIYRAACTLFDRLSLSQPVRLLGVRISNLRYQGGQESLFLEEQRSSAMIMAMDQVNDRFGEFTLGYGSVMLASEERGSYVIAPAWRPEGVRNVRVR